MNIVSHSIGRALRWTVAVLAVTAVLAMHGPSSGHMLAMPTHTAMSMAHAATTQHHSTGADIAKTTAGVTADGGQAMNHGDCLATTRHDPSTLDPAVLAEYSVRADGTRAAGTSPRSARASPPSLIRSCISRT